MPMDKNESRRFKKMHENFSYYNYVEKESLRLERLIDFLEHKLPNFVEINQAPRLVEIQKRKNEDMINLVLEKVTDEQSNLQLHLSHLFRQFFK